MNAPAIERALLFSNPAECKGAPPADRHFSSRNKVFCSAQWRAEAAKALAEQGSDEAMRLVRQYADVSSVVFLIQASPRRIAEIMARLIGLLRAEEEMVANYIVNCGAGPALHYEIFFVPKKISELYRRGRWPRFFSSAAVSPWGAAILRPPTSRRVIERGRPVFHDVVACIHRRGQQILPVVSMPERIEGNLGGSPGRARLASVWGVHEPGEKTFQNM